MLEKIELSAPDQRIADLANELMDIPIGWTDDPREIDRDAIRDFQRKLAEFLAQFEDRSELIDAAVVVSALLKASAAPPSDILPLPGLDGRIHPSSYALIYELVRDAFGSFHEDQNRTEIVERNLDAFFEAERDLLLSTGLNQQTVQIILTRLEMRRAAVALNLTRTHAISRSKWGRSLDAAINMTRIERLSARTRTEYVRAPILARLKDRAVGFATLWGDLVPLFYGKNIDVAGFISVVAGATLSTILPADPR
jgi:hypothetical protein